MVWHILQITSCKSLHCAWCFMRHANSAVEIYLNKLNLIRQNLQKMWRCDILWTSYKLVIWCYTCLYEWQCVVTTKGMYLGNILVFKWTKFVFQCFKNHDSVTKKCVGVTFCWPVISCYYCVYMPIWMTMCCDYYRN